ncbi:hypothetical protein ACIGW3_08050 [Streptomyces sp. NPDC053499]|uniref:hypothetical protein n=1 Tax=Streptomyces sp. NPDC053499 TaxID=3365707 RepID=UPI0037D96B73
MHPDVLQAQFRDRSRLIANWGIALLFVATVLWLWCGVLLTMPYEVKRHSTGGSLQCEPRLFTDEGAANEEKLEAPCTDERDWLEAVALLGVSVPAAVAGAVLLTCGRLSIRMSEHAQALITAREKAAREKAAASPDQAAPAGEQNST